VSEYHRSILTSFRARRARSESHLSDPLSYLQRRSLPECLRVMLNEIAPLHAIGLTTAGLSAAAVATESRVHTSLDELTARVGFRCSWLRNACAYPCSIAKQVLGQGRCAWHSRLALEAASAQLLAAPWCFMRLPAAPGDNRRRACNGRRKAGECL
jgi:hypothetical protein